MQSPEIFIVTNPETFAALMTSMLTTTSCETDDLVDEGVCVITGLPANNIPEEDRVTLIMGLLEEQFVIGLAGLPDEEAHNIYESLPPILSQYDFKSFHEFADRECILHKETGLIISQKGMLALNRAYSQMLCRQNTLALSIQADIRKRVNTKMLLENFIPN